MAIAMTGLADGSAITAVAASKLTGALPAISGAALTNLPGGGNAGQLNMAGTIVAKGNRMIVSGAGGGGGGGVQNGYGQNGGSGYWVSFGVVTVVKGETITVVLGTGGAKGIWVGSGSAGTATTYSGTTSGSNFLQLGGGGGGDMGSQTVNEGTLTGTIHSSFQQGAVRGIQGVTGPCTGVGGKTFLDYAGLGGRGSQGGSANGNTGQAGWSMIMGFLDV